MPFNDFFDGKNLVAPLSAVDAAINSGFGRKNGFLNVLSGLSILVVQSVAIVLYRPFGHYS